MTNNEKVGLGLVILAAVSYVIYEYYTCPKLTILSLNPVDGSGSFQFGDTMGSIAPGGYSGGWGWTLSFASFTPGVGWTIQVTKNGTMRLSTLVSSIGTHKLL